MPASLLPMTPCSFVRSTGVNRDNKRMVAGIICGAAAGLLIGLFIGRGIRPPNRVDPGSAMDQAQKRHQQYIDRQAAKTP